MKVQKFILGVIDMLLAQKFFAALEASMLYTALGPKIVTKSAETLQLSNEGKFNAIIKINCI